MTAIFDAKNRPLSANTGTLPDVSGAMLNWFQRLTFTRIVKTVVNFKVVETATNYSFQGVRQPFTPRQLEVLPEGQRKWRWETIHAQPSLVLDPDEIIYFSGTKYRVWNSVNYAEYGYVEYVIVEDYT